MKIEAKRKTAHGKRNQPTAAQTKADPEPKKETQILMRFRRERISTPTNSASPNRKGNCSDPAKSTRKSKQYTRDLKTDFFHCNPNKILTLKHRVTVLPLSFDY
jgi:hypothetical protein